MANPVFTHRPTIKSYNGLRPILGKKYENYVTQKRDVSFDNRMEGHPYHSETNPNMGLEMVATGLNPNRKVP